MRAWLIFWTASLWLAGGSFAAITLVVTVRGAKDLRQMFERLGEAKLAQTQPGQTQPGQNQPGQNQGEIENV